MARAFIIRPFGEKEDSKGNKLDFDRVEKELIDPALGATHTHLEGRTTAEIIEAGNIREDMFTLILEADLVICDVTIHNANVFYELGIRHALRKKRTIMIRGTTADSTPFDLSTDRYLSYDSDNPAAKKDDLVKMIQASLSSERETDSPVFRLLPALPEVNPTNVQVVPLAFREEVERARKSKDRLRLLAQDAQGLRFEWIGLGLIANAQWDLKDFEGARESWEAIRKIHPDNVTANLALSNIYERLYRSEKKPELLTYSDQAIERALASKDTSREQRVEALALKGRNQKTRWRWEFEGPGNVDKSLPDNADERMEAVMSQALLSSYEAYREAFYQDLNHFYSGLAALQMGTIFLELSAREDNNAWETLFDEDEEAKAYRLKLAKEIETLGVLVPASIQARLKQLSPADPDRIWAEISKADLLFLTTTNERRAIQRYKDVIPKDKPFAWDAAKGQLQLFAKLDIKADLANKVIDTIDRSLQSQTPTAEKPLHVVLFAGHHVDTPERAEPRFPPGREDRAKELIRKQLQEKRTSLGQDCDFRAFAGAGPGADILFHEVCDELDIDSRICLPMPSNDYVQRAFANLDAWRSRFFALKNLQERKCELSDRAELPNWLQGTKKDVWERCNRWILQMALTEGAKQTTLLALWDGKKDESDGLDGTAYLVQLARDAGNIDIECIDTKELLESGSVTSTAFLPP